MLEAIKQFFSQHIEAETDAQHRLDLAAAALLFEIAFADNQLQQEELATLRKLLTTLFHITEEDVTTLIALAKEESQTTADIYQFTRLINDNFEYQDKCKLVYSLWKVAYADGDLDKYEEYTIRKISDLIYVDHADFIRMKSQAKPL